MDFLNNKLLLLLLMTINAVGGQVAHTEDQWVVREEFFNMLPAILSPIFEANAKTSGECLLYCQLKNCSSAAYSSMYQLCKLYSHPSSPKPLPTLAVDPANKGFQMYYKRFFCPPGWDEDLRSRMCYYAGTATDAVQRPAAWQVCEDQFMSNLVTFQTAEQRSNLYSILRTKYSTVSKWWTGYAMFDSNLWPRAVEEIPGYVRRRGTGGNDLATLSSVTPLQCAWNCDRKYHDQCVGFSYDRIANTCFLKFRTPDNSAAILSTEKWFYEKVTATRPPTLTYGDCAGSDIKQFSGVSRDQCKQLCRQSLHCVAFAYRISIRNCWLKTKTCIAKTTTCANDCEMWDFDYTNDGPCQWGVRYRDVCLTIFRASQNWNSQYQACREMGGKMITPSEKRRNEMIRVANIRYNWDYWLDWSNEGHVSNWTTYDGSLNLQDPVYEKWSFNPGEPTGNGNFAHLAGCFQTDTGNGCKMDDVASSTTYYTVCESPTSQSWPQTCLFTPPGREYQGTATKTASNVNCKMWGLTSAYANGTKWQRFPDWFVNHTYCRNPDPSVISSGVWCYRSDNDQPEACSAVPMCPETDWASGQTFTDPLSPYAAITYKSAAADKYDWTVESATGYANPLCSLNMADWCPYYFQGSCYTIYTVQYTSDEAQARCSLNGWHLVTITSKDEQNFLMGITQSQGKQWFVPTGYTIGLRGNSATGYTWITGEPFLVSFWQAGEPHGGAEACHFIYAQSTGYWFDYFCWYKTWFICEIDLAK